MRLELPQELEGRKGYHSETERLSGSQRAAVQVVVRVRQVRLPLRHRRLARRVHRTERLLDEQSASIGVANR